MTTKGYPWGFRAENNPDLISFSIHSTNKFWGMSCSDYTEFITQEYRWFLTGLFVDDLDDPERHYYCGVDDRFRQDIFLIGYQSVYWRYPDKSSEILGLEDVLGDMYSANSTGLTS